MSFGIAIETSGRVGSIASVRDDEILAEEEFPHGLKHAAEIVPIMDRLCRDQGWKPGDLNHLYISTGPGSFTGLRIAVTVAKTMAFATGVKIVAVPTIRVLAENAPAEARHLIIVLDAKRDQIFTARMERQGSSWIEHEPAHLDRLDAMIERSPRPVYLLGEGIPFHENFIPKADALMKATSPELWRARAGAVAKLGIEMASRYDFAEPYRLAPIYIRRPEAEEKFEQNSKVKT